MQYSDFVRRVQKHAGLKTIEQAIIVTHATLETLGERIDRTNRDNLASQLPGELKDALLRCAQTRRFTLEAFYSRVAARARLGGQNAVSQVKSVLAVLREAVAEGEIQHIVEDLPEEYEEILCETEEV